jgi:hypothetical protein
VKFTIQDEKLQGKKGKNEYWTGKKVEVMARDFFRASCLQGWQNL